MKQLLMLIALPAFALAAAAQNAADYRGGRRTDGGEAHTYEFSIRGAAVRGVYRVAGLRPRILAAGGDSDRGDVG
jgi:hypothetical protein